jgi:hypothetical protein
MKSAFAFNRISTRFWPVDIHHCGNPHSSEFAFGCIAFSCAVKLRNGNRKIEISSIMDLFRFIMIGFL